MTKARWVLCTAIVLAGMGAASVHGEVNVPLTDFRLVMGAAMQTASGLSPYPDRTEETAYAEFTKLVPERRLLALEAKPVSSLVGAQAIAIRYRVKLIQGEAPRLAVLVFERDGGSWYTISNQPVELTTFADRRLSVAGLRQTAFSQDESGELEWDSVGRVWVGLVMDGQASGTFEIRSARLTDEPYRPDKPLPITGADPGTWSLGKDPAVAAEVTTPADGPDGSPCMKLDLRFPGGRHMYCTPSTPVPPADLEGYRALRFTYKASLPPDIPGLLVMLQERGGAQYLVDPAPPASATWTTATVPLEKFKLGGWSRDANGKLDLEQVSLVYVGVHGVASGEGGPGTILATDIEFVP